MGIARFIVDMVWPMLMAALAIGAILDIVVFKSKGRITITSVLLAGTMAVYLLALLAVTFRLA